MADIIRFGRWDGVINVSWPLFISLIANVLLLGWMALPRTSPDLLIAQAYVCGYAQGTHPTTHIATEQCVAAQQKAIDQGLIHIEDGHIRAGRKP